MNYFVKLLIILLFSSPALITCKKAPTDSETVSLSGTVHLEGMNNHADVQVSLYALAEPDSELAPIKQQYPNLGVELSQEVLFDHRQYNAISATRTSNNGVFTFYNIKAGIYNLVAEKEGYGWQYLHNVEITQYEQEPVDIDIRLYQEIVLRGMLPQSTTLLQDHHYHATADVVVPVGGMLEIEPGVTIKFDHNVALVINGKLEAQGNKDEYIWMTSKMQNYYWRGLEKSNGESEFILDYTKINYSLSGLSVTNGMVKVTNSFFSYNKNYGFYIGQSEKVNCSHSIFLINHHGIKLELIQNAEISYNIFLGKSRLKESIGYINNTTVANFNNNIITNVKTAVAVQYDSDIIIQYNHIKKCEDAINIYLIKNNKCRILYNLIEECYRAAFYITRNGFPQIQYNNIYSLNYLLYLGGFYDDYSQNIILSYNFWGTIYIEEIRRQILDQRHGTDDTAEDNLVMKPIMQKPIENAKPQ